MNTVVQIALSPEALAAMIKAAVKEALHSYPMPSKEDVLPELMTMQEVMRFLDKSRNTVKNYTTAGRLTMSGKKFHRSEVLGIKHNRSK